jgi:ornithine carbamoyltransferase
MDCLTTPMNAPTDVHLGSAQHHQLLQEAGRLGAAARAEAPANLLSGAHLALVCGEGGFDAGALLMDAARGLGARVAHLRPLHAAPDPAMRMLSRLYRAVACEGLDAHAVERLSRQADLPVLKDLAAASHPARGLADLLAIQASHARPIEALRLGLAAAPESKLGRMWQTNAALSGLQLRFGAHRDDAAIDIFCDPELPPCTDGRPILWSLRDLDGASGPLRSLAPEQQRQHRHLVQALLLHALA